MDRQRQIIAAGGMTIGAAAIIAGILFWPKGEPNAGAQGAPGKPGVGVGAPNPRQKQNPAAQTPGQKPGQKPGPGATAQGQPKTGGPGLPAARPGARGVPATAKSAGGIPGAIPGVGGAPATAPKVVYKMPFKPRRDPTELLWRIPPPPPYVFREIEPMRVASFQVATPPPPNTEVREVPSRRVSGIMSGDGVFAILEGEGGEVEIVKPGMETKDGYKVVSISADTVTLKKKEGNIIRTQIVPLSDIPPGQQPQVGGGRFGAGMRGGPTGGPSAAGTSGPGGGQPGRRGGGGSTGTKE